MLTALGWLVPNHYYPWVAFHVDAWIAWSFLIGTGALMLSFRVPLDWHWAPILTAVLVSVPFAQWAGGMLAFQGQAWIVGTYLVGLTLSLLAGTHAEKLYPGCAIEFVLAALGVASVCSVGLQLAQWLGLDVVGIWVLPLPPTESRPFANLGQPNQLATLHVWGLVAVAWAALRGRVGTTVAIGTAAFILTGIALTQSRTAIVAIAVLLAATFHWRGLWPAPRAVIVANSCLVAFYVACLAALSPLSSMLYLEKPYDAVARIGGGDIRWSVYMMFLEAAWQKPWLGYGWSSLAPVQMAVAEHHPPLRGVFQHSHNLFLDLILWLGIPLGLIISGALCLWFIRAFLRIKRAEDALLFLMVAVVGLHSMLELPLHYAYVLVPAGFVSGVLNARLAAPAFRLRVSRALLIAVGLNATLLLGLITRDYLRIENDFQALRFERMYNMPRTIEPRVVLLDQLLEFNRLGRASAAPGMTVSALEQMQAVADAFPSPANLYVYVAALALNDRGEEAHARMRKMSRMMEPTAYQELGRIWRRQSETNPLLARVPWID